MPKNSVVIDVIPKNEAVIDILPKNEAIDPLSATRSYNVVINAGQYMGLPFLLTYPANLGTLTQWSESGFDH